MIASNRETGTRSIGWSAETVNAGGRTARRWGAAPARHPGRHQKGKDGRPPPPTSSQPLGSPALPACASSSSAPPADPTRTPSSRELGAPVGDLPPWRLLGCEQTGLPSIPERASRSLRQNPHLLVAAQQFFCSTSIFSRASRALRCFPTQRRAVSRLRAHTRAAGLRARHPPKAVLLKALRSRRARRDQASPPIPAHSTPAATRTQIRSRTR